MYSVQRHVVGRQKAVQQYRQDIQDSICITIEPFVHLLEYCIIVCVECKHVVLPSHVDAHLKDKNKYNTTKEEQEQIYQEVQQIEGLIEEQAELNKISFLPLSNLLILILQEL